MKVLLINPQTSWKGEHDLQDLTRRNFNDHLGIGYIAASLEKHGHKADLLDAHFEELSLDQVFERVDCSEYDVYGISFVEAIVEETLAIAQRIKARSPEAKIIIGGYGATMIGEKLLMDCRDIDAAVTGEGEASVVELVDAIHDRNLWHGVNGIMFVKDDRVVRTEARALIPDLDELPWPKRGTNYKYGRANILASRGCYGACTYCSIIEFYGKFKGSRVRVRDPIKLVDEMEHVVKTHGVHHFDFVDDNFTGTCKGNFDWPLAFAAEIKKRDLKITWGIQARANDIREELFEILAGCGLRVVSMGIENDVVRVMKLFRTGTSKKVHRRAVAILRKLRINMYIEMILLEPTATLEEISENLDFLHEIEFSEIYRQNPITFTTKLHLYTGTPVAKQMEEYSQVSENGYHISYEFQDPKVHQLSQALVEWQERTAELATYQLSYLQYEASARGHLGLAMRIIKLSKQYLKFDLNFYGKIIEFINRNPNYSQTELDSFMDSFDEELEYMKREFRAARKKISSAGETETAVKANPVFATGNAF